MRVKKETVIKLLQTEPLHAGDWIRYDGKPPEECEVCAVGAVVRYAFQKKRKSIAFNHAIPLEFNTACYISTECVYLPYDGNYKAELHYKNYLGALSIYFEELMADKDIKIPSTAERKKLVKFVEKYFPKTVSIEV